LKKIVVLALLMTLASPGMAQTKRIGILPFDDAAGVGPELGAQVALFIRAELLKTRKAVPKFIQYAPEGEEAGPIDIEKAIELGRENEVDFVVIGTILEAESTSSESGIDGISFDKGSVGAALRKVKATIVIQGDLISVEKGTLIESYEASGSKTDKSVGADISTDWAGYNTDSYKGDGPNGKALREAVEKLVKWMVKKI
jgi:curli biogenesis system outer membrane secretion channel CsgG